MLALLAAVFVWWLLNRSTVGFELRAVGANPDASRTAGMSVGRAYIIAMVVAGALAGLAGTQQVLGTDLPLTDGVAASVGFDAITVALLGRGTPLGTVLAGLLFGALNAGGLQMQLQTQTPLTLTTVLQAVIVLFVAAPALVRSIFRFLPKERGTGPSSRKAGTDERDDSRRRPAAPAKAQAIEAPAERSRRLRVGGLMLVFALIGLGLAIGTKGGKATFQLVSGDLQNNLLGVPAQFDRAGARDPRSASPPGPICCAGSRSRTPATWPRCSGSASSAPSCAGPPRARPSRWPTSSRAR